MVRFHLLPPISPQAKLSRRSREAKADRARRPMLRIGGITQLVECLLCKQNVAGSNPTTSTNQVHLRQSVKEP